MLLWLSAIVDKFQGSSNVVADEISVLGRISGLKSKEIIVNFHFITGYNMYLDMNGK